MNYNQLFESGGNVFFVVGLESDELMPLRGELARQFAAATVRSIRSAKSTDEENFFDEIGAALQFPDDFVELWENFEALINNLGWLPDGPLLLLFTFAPFLLCDEPPAVFGELIEQLYRAARNHHSASLKVLFHAIPDDLPAFFDRLEIAGATYTVLES